MLKECCSSLCESLHPLGPLVSLCKRWELLLLHSSCWSGQACQLDLGKEAGCRKLGACMTMPHEKAHMLASKKGMRAYLAKGLPCPAAVPLMKVVGEYPLTCTITQRTFKDCRCGWFTGLHGHHASRKIAYVSTMPVLAHINQLKQDAGRGPKLRLPTS